MQEARRGPAGSWVRTGALFLARLSDFAVPHLCLNCLEPAEFSEHPALCAACADTRWKKARCHRCGDRCHPDERARGRCYRCRSLSLPYTSLQTLGAYRQWLRKAILLWKFHQDELALDWLRKAALNFERRKEDGRAVISYIPSHPARIRARGGHGQHLPRMLAELARAWRLPVVELFDKKLTPAPQVELSGARRREAVAGTLDLRLEEHRAQTLYLFDDVWTTGSTMREACRALKAAGVGTVHACAFAMTTLDL